MTKLAKRLYEHVKRTQLLPRGTHVLAACSGGPDSMALLLLLQELAPMLRLTVTVAHYDHGLRGAASVADAAFVASFCEAHDIPCRQGAAQCGSIAGAKASVETEARRQRYAFLEAARREAHADVICTAHHADDQAETVLMHLLRGTGLDGLAGIPACDETRHLVRPLLPFRKAELVAYCTERGVAPRHDATNDVPDGLRNRVRLTLLPALAHAYNPRIREGLCRLAAIAAEERQALDDLADDAALRCMRRTAGGPMLDAKGVAKLPRAIARRVLRRYLTALGHPVDVSAERTEALLTLLTSEGGRRIELPGITLTKEHGWIRPAVSLDRKHIINNQQES